jgi:hypothetical protein
VSHSARRNYRYCPYQQNNIIFSLLSISINNTISSLLSISTNTIKLDFVIFCEDDCFSEKRLLKLVWVFMGFHDIFRDFVGSDHILVW